MKLTDTDEKHGTDTLVYYLPIESTHKKNEFYTNKTEGIAK